MKKLSLRYFLLFCLAVSSSADKNSSSPARVLPIDSGVVMEGSIHTPGHTDRYTFTGVVGQRLYYDVLGAPFLWPSHPYNVYLLSPSGALLWNSYYGNDVGPFTLTEAGVHQLVVEGDGGVTEAYSFRLLDVAAATPVGFGERVHGTTAGPRFGAALYKFRGDAGSRVVLNRIVSTETQIYWSLIGPGNETLASDFIHANLGPVTLPLSGDHTIVVSSLSRSLFPADYWFEVQRVDDPIVEATGFGIVHSGTIDMGEMETFTYSASAGTPVYFDYMRVGGSELTFDLQDAAGNRLMLQYGYDAGPIVLQRSGTYKLFVYGWSPTSTDSFRFRILNLNAVPEAPLNSLVTGHTTEPNQTDVYRVNAAAGQALVFDAVSDKDGIEALLSMPTGSRGVETLFWGEARFDAGPATLRYPGGLFQLIELPEPGDYGFRIVDAGGPLAPRIPPGTLVGAPLQVVPSSALELTGSYISGSLRGRPDQDDWRASQSVEGLRNDAQVDFADPNWGRLFDVGLSAGINGDDEHWQDFSVQWDGKITITTPRTRLFLKSQYGSRMWIDLDNNGSFDTEGPELVNNHWGEGVGLALSAGSIPLAAGEYRIRIQYEQSSGGAYMHLLMDGGISLAPGETKLFRIAGNAGDRLFFDSLAPVSSGAWSVFGVRGEWLAGVELGRDFELTLPYSGDFLLALNNWTTATEFSSYAFKVLKAVNVERTISIGDLVSGRISSPGELHHLHFAGRAGQRLFYDALEANYDPVYVKLLSPRGVTLALFEINADNDVGPFNLPETGEYTLMLGFGGDAVATYAFRLIDIATQPAISSDAAITGTAAPYEAKFWRFNSDADVRFFLKSLDLSSAASAGVYEPFNYQFAGNGLAGDLEFVTYDAGEFLVAISNGTAEATPYSFRLFRPKSPTQALAHGATVTASIPGPGDWAVYTVPGIAGQKVYFDALDLSSSDTYVRLVTPNGQNVFTTESYADAGPFTLPADGEYQLTVDAVGRVESSVRFRLLNLASATAIALEARVDGSLNPRSSSALFRFNGTAGQRVNLISVAASATAANWRLVGTRNESLLAGPINASLGATTLPTSGTYYIIVEGEAESVFPLDFAFRVNDVSDAPVAGSGFGEIHSGTLEPGASASFTYSALAGTPVYFDNLRSVDWSLLHRLEFSDSTSVFSGVPYDLGDYSLPRSGTYTLTVVNNGGTAADFAFRLLNLNDAPALPMGATVKATLTRPFEAAVYRATVAAGQKLAFDGLEGPVSVWASFFTRDRTYADAWVASNSAVFTVLDSGVIYLAVQNYEQPSSDVYFRVLDVTSVPATIVFDTPVGSVSSGLIPVKAENLSVVGSYINGSLRDRPDMDDWRVSQTIAGTRADATINFLENSWGTRSSVGLTSGSDEDWEDFSVQWDGTVTITEPGTRLFVSSDDGARFFIDLNRDSSFDASGPEFIDNGWGSSHGAYLSPSTVALAPGTYTIRIQYEEGFGANSISLLYETGAASVGHNDAVIYKFHAEAGQRLYINSTNPNANRGLWSILDPDNQYITSSYFPNDIEFTPTKSGEHLLLITAEGSSGVFFGFRILTPETRRLDLVYNSAYPGSIGAPGEIHEYLFNGNAGDRLYYDALASAVDDVYASLIGPSGELTYLINGDADQDAGPFFLPQSGQYRLVIRGYADALGDYRFRLLDVNSQPVAPLDTLITGTLTGQAAMLFQIPFPAGMPIYVDGGTGSPASWLLWSAGNNYLAGDTLGYDLRATAPLPGANLLVLTSGSNADIPYAFRIFPGNHAPVIAPIADITADEGRPLVIPVNIEDLDFPNDTVTTMVEGMPEGMTFNAARGEISWTPSERQGPGFYRLTIHTMDDGVPSLGDSRSFSITISEVNEAPFLDPISDWTVGAGERIDITARATDFDIPANVLKFAIRGLPPGPNRFSEDTGVLYLRPAISSAGATYTVEMEVADNGVPIKSMSRAFQVTVRPFGPIRIIHQQWSERGLEVTVNGEIGPEYTLQGSTDLENWADLNSALPTDSPFVLTDIDSVMDFRFYRIRAQAYAGGP